MAEDKRIRVDIDPEVLNKAQMIYLRQHKDKSLPTTKEVLEFVIRTY